MVIRIVIAGESQCETFAQVCLVADYISQNLPNFCYEQIKKSVLEWQAWLSKINQKNKWHHINSPIVWKEMLMKGSKPVYIGGASEFLEYCYSYYNFDAFMASSKFCGLVKNFGQYQEKLKVETFSKPTAEFSKVIASEMKPNEKCHKNIVITISGVSNPLAIHILSGLLEMSNLGLSKVYIYDKDCSAEHMELVERQCNYIMTCNSGKTVKYVEKLGMALTHTNLLIILDHVLFNFFSHDLPMGEWLKMNKKKMQNIALIINTSASREMFVMFPNVGPACYNATVLIDKTILDHRNIVVATSDLGLEISSVAAEIAEIPLRNMYCPPVWGFVGINHLVDICTTVHKYNSFEPYKRYYKVRNSSLKIGTLTPEMRTMEYLMLSDESLWEKVSRNQAKRAKDQIAINKALAVLNVIKVWLFDVRTDQIVNLGIKCNGTFGLKFKGIFSQPARFVNGHWLPAEDFLLPRDRQMKLCYLDKMAEFVMTLNRNSLPNIIPRNFCFCKTQVLKKKIGW
ncbi:putative malate dehydrogenase 1B isoform X1 [Bombyx mori]|uniref:putative malate dehydrogenase 1B isoform X1 n=1 Tax=Bombyx mori TaxID=7091 RepID=UPI002ECFEA50